MHRYLTGHWAASGYSVRGERADHVLLLSPDGSFRWTTDSQTPARSEIRTGRWTHDTKQDVLTLSQSDDTGKASEASWSIQYVTGCEDANTLLVLRRLILASRNLPILFLRIHPPDDPVWRG